MRGSEVAAPNVLLETLRRRLDCKFTKKCDLIHMNRTAGGHEVFLIVSFERVFVTLCLWECSFVNGNVSIATMLFRPRKHYIYHTVIHYTLFDLVKGTTFQDNVSYQSYVS